jgi:5-(carboxyamino)imidazole ribonucleotide mutase
MAKSDKILVGVLTGSPNDLPTVEKAKQTLDRTPDMTVDYVKSAEAAGVEVFIACAGMANHLAGTVAAHTLRPVIGVPLSGGILEGLDALLSTVQMPPGVPVATVAVDGAKNAAYLAAQILAITHPETRAKLEEARAAARKRYES